MKQNAKIFLFALVLGIGVAIFINTKFDTSIITNAMDARITYLAIGTYNNIEDANNKSNTYNGSFVYDDGGIYKVLIGVYTEDESVLLMSSYFQDKDINFTKGELKVNNNVIKALKNYEMLIKTSDSTYYENINNSLLQVFREYLN